MLTRIARQKPLAIAMSYGRRGQHLRIQKRVARHQAMEDAAMPVRPIHHRSNTESMCLILHAFSG